MEKRQLNRIGEVLSEQGRSNKWLAGKLKTHFNTVSKWVNNEQQPHLDVFYEMSLHLSCDIRELINTTKDISNRYGK